MLVLDVFIIFGYFLIFPRLLKDYYLYMLPVYMSLFLGIYVYLLYKKITLKIVLVGLGIGLFVLFGWDVQTRISDRSIEMYGNQLSVIDVIYANAMGSSFKVYTYTPVIYDYTYQYLFSWYGNKHYGYIPQDYAYLPDEPEYVLKKAVFDEGKVYGMDSDFMPIYLVAENYSHDYYGQQAWLDHFGSDGKNEIYNTKSISVWKIE